jgi:SAM-dependent methyltransferase
MFKDLVNGWRARRKERRRLSKFETARAQMEGLSVQDAFERIYAEAKWGAAPDGSSFWSGNGSKADQSAAYENYVVELLARFPHLSSIVDIGCGDFQVSGRILRRASRPVDYLGLDVVRGLIDHHTAAHAAPGIRFAVCNAVEEPLPRGDLGITRQILQHLSNEQVKTILYKASKSFKALLVVESLPLSMKAANLDMAHGITTRVSLGSGVYIDQPPFSLGVVEQFDARHTETELLRTSLVWLDKDRPFKAK